MLRPWEEADVATADKCFWLIKMDEDTRDKERFDVARIMVSSTARGEC